MSLCEYLKKIALVGGLAVSSFGCSTSESVRSSSEEDIREKKIYLSAVDKKAEIRNYFEEYSERLKFEKKSKLELEANNSSIKKILDEADSVVESLFDQEYNVSPELKRFLENDYDKDFSLDIPDEYKNTQAEDVIHKSRDLCKLYKSLFELQEKSAKIISELEPFGFEEKIEDPKFQISRTEGEIIYGRLDDYTAEIYNKILGKDMPDDIYEHISKFTKILPSDDTYAVTLSKVLHELGHLENTYAQELLNEKNKVMRDISRQTQEDDREFVAYAFQLAAMSCVDDKILKQAMQNNWQQLIESSNYLGDSFIESNIFHIMRIDEIEASVSYFDSPAVLYQHANSRKINTIDPKIRAIESYHQRTIYNNFDDQMELVECIGHYKLLATEFESSVDKALMYFTPYLIDRLNILSHTFENYSQGLDNIIEGLNNLVNTKNISENRKRRNQAIFNNLKPCTRDVNNQRIF